MPLISCQRTKLIIEFPGQALYHYFIIHQSNCFLPNILLKDHATTVISCLYYLHFKKRLDAVLYLCAFSWHLYFLSPLACVSFHAEFSCPQRKFISSFAWTLDGHCPNKSTIIPLQRIVIIATVYVLGSLQMPSVFCLFYFISQINRAMLRITDSIIHITQQAST